VFISKKFSVELQFILYFHEILLPLHPKKKEFVMAEELKGYQPSAQTSRRRAQDKKRYGYGNNKSERMQRLFFWLVAAVAVVVMALCVVIYFLDT
jgi:hypothetical protein